MQLHWLPVSQRIQFKIILLMFKAYHSLAPSYLCDSIAHYKPVYYTRSSDKELADSRNRSNLQYGQRAFSRLGPKEWNHLPDDMRMITSIDKFKSALKKYLFKKAYDLKWFYVFIFFTQRLWTVIDLWCIYLLIIYIYLLCKSFSCCTVPLNILIEMAHKYQFYYLLLLISIMSNIITWYFYITL